MIRPLVILGLTVGNVLPVCEGIVDYSLEKQPVSYLRRSSEREHVNGPQSWMSLAQTTANRITQNIQDETCSD